MCIFVNQTVFMRIRIRKCTSEVVPALCMDMKCSSRIIVVRNRCQRMR